MNSFSFLNPIGIISNAAANLVSTIKNPLTNVATDFLEEQMKLSCATQDPFIAEQARKEEQLKNEKEEIQNAQAERERLMEERHEQWERKQKEMNEVVKEHQRILTEEAKEGLKRSHAEYERQMALERERLAKEEEFMTNAHLEHKRCLEDEIKRLQQSQANYERRLTEDRQRIAHEMKTFAETQKKWDDDRVVLKQNYDKLQSKLDEGYQQLRRDQRALEERLESKMEDMMDEQKNWTVLEKEQKLKDLTETYLCHCEMYGNDLENMTTETKVFQRKFMLQLMRVKNSMQIGDNSMARFKIWANGASLHLKMLTFLCDRGAVKHEALQAVNQQYQRDMCVLASTFNALPATVEKTSAIENSFHHQLQEVESYINKALPSSPSALLAIQVSAAKTSNILPPICTESAATGGGVSSVPVQRQVQLLPANPTSDGALVQALQQSVLGDEAQPPGDASLVRCNALTQSLR